MNGMIMKNGKEQGYVKILAILVAAWIMYCCYVLITKGEKVSLKPDYSPSKSSISGVKKMSKQELKDMLGRSTWTLLHVIGSKYPAFPTSQQKKDTLSFVHLLSSVFPCEECRKHFQGLLAMHPPRVGSNDEFKTWLCEAHNIVNKRIGKPEVDCKTVDDLWDCGCEA
ncbi:Erv1/Alr protein [Ordospora pajunii]|jgi:FAD-linked sulfhydryl oxidase|uniref:Erv1/Alr protein n=1 Tax=Ordospora pajunii TaxID=3039483 RepID=UPI0029527A31|nr:Erv1/Alr protein [Ordospora pajunii]KAH9411222.1 Erv1/Alr protein [Ordospora pajunii]